MAPAPWESVPAHDTLFVLVTGSNSGIGLGICERLIDDFLTERSLTSHLILIPTTRSTRKSSDTITSLRRHLSHAASAKSLRARGIGSPQDAIDRVHVLSVQLDLCDLTAVQRTADQLVSGTVTLDGSGEVRIPRLDAVIFNAGIGGWDGVDWLGFGLDIVKRGYIQATTRPEAKKSTPGLVVNPIPSAKNKGGHSSETAPVLGQVFCANTFGHYYFAHKLLPLLNRKNGNDEDIATGRIIWQSSLDPALSHFKLSDFQGIRTTDAYGSSKMLTDFLCLTADLPSVKPYSAPFWSTSAQPAPPARPANFYVAHPGIVTTTLFPLHWVMMWGYRLGLLLARWIGSPWHPTYSYTAAISAVWLTLATQETLDRANANHVKWGSATDFWGNALVKKTEVEGWGWEGKVEDIEDTDGATGVLRKSIGRRYRPELVTEKDLVEFEEVGKEAWKEMERLRVEWETRLQEQS